MSIDDESNENSDLSEDNNSRQTKLTLHEFNEKSLRLKYLFLMDEFCKLY